MFNTTKEAFQNGFLGWFQELEKEASAKPLELQSPATIKLASALGLLAEEDEVSKEASAEVTYDSLLDKLQKLASAPGTAPTQSFGRRMANKAYYGAQDAYGKAKNFVSNNKGKLYAGAGGYLAGRLVSRLGYRAGKKKQEKED